MSSISALGSNQSTYTGPLQQLEAELQSEVSAGTVSSSDQSALSSARTNINSSLTSGQLSPSSSADSSGALLCNDWNCGCVRLACRVNAHQLPGLRTFGVSWFAMARRQ
jgi:hypothetical protein